MSDRAIKSGNEDSVPIITLTIPNVHPTHVADARYYLRHEVQAAEAVGVKVVVKEMSSLRSAEHDKFLYELSQRRYAVCLWPFRAEPRGYLGLKAHSCGVPSLVPTDASVAPLLLRFVNEPDYFLAPVTKDVAAVKADSAVWASHIVKVLDNIDHADQIAAQLKEDLRTDEMTIQSCDDFYHYCLGGIGLRFEVTSVFFINPAESDEGLDGPRDLETRKRFNRFVISALRQCWRVKRYPMQNVKDLRPLLKNLPRLPVDDLTSKVIDLVEDRNRRIVDVDCDTNSLVVYCCDVDSLRDLWAICDRINIALRSVFFPKRHPSTNPILREFGLRKALSRVSISGPQFLSYKQHLVDMREDQPPVIGDE